MRRSKQCCPCPTPCAHPETPRTKQKPMPGCPTVQQLFPGPESAHTELSCLGSTMAQINVSLGGPGPTLLASRASHRSSLSRPVHKTALHRCCNTSHSLLTCCPQGLAQIALQLAGCFCGVSYPVCLTGCQLQESSRPTKKCLQQDHRDASAARAGSRDTHDW